jgi:NDP-sugar pyrophosphorylase family protein
MNIIIPLGGKGERFRKEGYTLPKPLIKVLNKEILFHVLDNINITYEDHIFIIYNKELDNDYFSNIITLKYPYIKLIKLPYDTKGAAETINIGIKEIIYNKHHDKTILIDGDTFYTSDIITKFRNTNIYNAVYYTINRDPNPVFSYIKINNENNENNENNINLITDIKEKNKISDNANTGIYAFQSIYELLKYSQYILDNNILFNNEPYISCIIYEMIKDNKQFIGIELDENDVHVLGTPEQVSQFINKSQLKNYDRLYSH